MAASQKDIIYIDIDDEITAVIEKLQASSGKIVALVLPKRATVFQSIVNMKLLKRAAASGNKNLVLITSDKSILPLAGAVGLHVANTPQSKPVIPAAPQQSDAPLSVDEIEVGEPAEEESVTQAPAAAFSPDNTEDEEEAVEIDNEPSTPSRRAAKGAAAAGAAKGANKQFNKKLQVPDFNKFRKKLLIGAGLLVLLIVAFVFAANVLPKAKLTLKVNTTEVSAAIDVISSPQIQELDQQRARVPGALKEYKKVETQKAAATGQKDLGEKAKGSVTMSAKSTCSPGFSVPAGTTVSSGNFSFVTQAPAKLNPVDVEDGKCVFQSGSVAVIASKAGDGYNLSARDYTVSGFSSVTAKGSAMSGGTSKVIKVVSQQDIDGLRRQIVESIGAIANEEVSKLLRDENYLPLPETFTAKEPVVSASPAVDAEATEVTVTVELSYTMAGASRDALDTLLKDALNEQIDTKQQRILNNGLSNATIRITNKKDNGETSFELSVKATAGVEQNQDDIKAAVAGMKKSEAESTIRSRQGVLDVTVEYSPFWVSKVPSNPDKVEVIFEGQTTDSSDE